MKYIGLVVAGVWIGILTLLFLLLPLTMKTPQFLPAFESLEKVRAGDFDAIADALGVLLKGQNESAQSIAQRIGNWKNYGPYLSTDFYSDVSATGWVVEAADIKTFEYLVIDNVMFVGGVIENTTVTLDADELYIPVPGGLKIGPSSRFNGMLAYNQVEGATTSAQGTSYVNGTVNQNRIGLTRFSGSQWHAAATRIDVYFSIWFHIASPAGG